MKWTSILPEKDNNFSFFICFVPKNEYFCMRIFQNQRPMEQSQQTIQQVDRAIEKTICKFTKGEDDMVFTDLHFRVIADSGEMLTFDDDEEEINRCVISDWIGSTDDAFYHQVAALLRQRLHAHSAQIEKMGIAKPFSFVLEDDEHEAIAELYLADDDTIIIGGDLMKDLDNDLDTFFDDLMKE